MEIPNREVNRKPLHKRKIEIQGFLREDGLWEVEALLFDTKAYPIELFDPEVGKVNVGEPLHHMLLTLTLDDSMNILDARAKMLATPYIDCPNAAVSYSNLIGLQIKKGWIDDVRKNMRRNRACTHLTEILPALATAAIQTIRGYRLHNTPGFVNSDEEKNHHSDTCYGFRKGGRAESLIWKS